MIACVSLASSPPAWTHEKARVTTGRVLVVAQSDGSGHVFTYRADGELVEAKNAGTTVKFERDALGGVVKEFQDEHWVETRYGPTGLRVKMKSSLGAEQEIQRTYRREAGTKAPSSFPRARIRMRLRRIVLPGRQW
jgi:hypothetical protein